ncbi:MAG: chromate transporter [Acholeplasmatales bacterium]|nr:chromate transporter [Acholeplasmatales bacterium]
MIFLSLFFTFLKIGLFTIGGGYAMIPMINDEVISKGWISEADLTNFLAISESTPGPFAINMATFIGYEKAGFLGAVCATLGIILPSLIIIIIISKIIAKFLNNKYVNYAMQGVRPVVVGLIFAVAISLVYASFLPNGFDIKNISFASIIIFGISVGLLSFKKTRNPIIVIVVSGVLGIVFFGLFKMR